MAKLGSDLNSIEVVYITPVVNDAGKVLKRHVVRKSVLSLAHILVIDENFNSRGKLIEDTCRIYYDTLGWIVLQESYEEMSRYKMGHQSTIIGFQTNINKKRNDTKRNTRKNA